MVTYRVILSRQACKDAEHIRAAKLGRRVQELLALLADDPYRIPPPCEKLKGRLEGLYSRRINRQHRLVYDVQGDVVHVLSLWSHYERV